MGFDLDLVRTPRGQMVWLDSIVAVSQRGRPADRARRAQVPPLAADERLVLSSCSVDGSSIRGSSPSSSPTRARRRLERALVTIRQAWRADAASAQFEVIPVTDLARRARFVKSSKRQLRHSRRMVSWESRPDGGSSFSLRRGSGLIDARCIALNIGGATFCFPKLNQLTVFDEPTRDS